MRSHKEIAGRNGALGQGMRSEDARTGQGVVLGQGMRSEDAESGKAGVEGRRSARTGKYETGREAAYRFPLRGARIGLGTGQNSSGKKNCNAARTGPNLFGRSQNLSVAKLLGELPRWEPTQSWVGGLG